MAGHFQHKGIQQSSVISSNFPYRHATLVYLIMVGLPPFNKAHEALVSEHQGSQIIDIILTVLPIVTASGIAASFLSEKKSHLWCFITEFVICVVPLIFSFTILNQATLELNAVLIFVLMIRMVILHQKDPGIKNTNLKISHDTRLTWLTSCRAAVNIATIIAILAVDFHIFPRRFAKTEDYGYSLMDVGAACFLFMNGMTDFKKRVLTRQTVRDVVVLTLLGLFRVFSLRAVDFQQNVTEYGVHCNFFFTLAFVKASCVWWAGKLPLIVRLTLCIAFACLHETGLRVVGLDVWTFSMATRKEGLITPNREWFVSLPGNVLVYLLGVSTGEVIFTKFKKDFHLKTQVVMTVTPFLFLFFFEVVLDWEPSRRLANLSFVAWIVGFYLLFMTLFRASESLFGGPIRCRLFEAVNSFPLHFFLLGNVLTGLVNLCVNSMEVNAFPALIIVLVYTFLTCSVVQLLVCYRSSLDSIFRRC